MTVRIIATVHAMSKTNYYINEVMTLVDLRGGHRNVLQDVKVPLKVPSQSRKYDEMPFKMPPGESKS